MSILLRRCSGRRDETTCLVAAPSRRAIRIATVFPDTGRRGGRELAHLDVATALQRAGNPVHAFVGAAGEAHEVWRSSVAALTTVPMVRGGARRGHVVRDLAQLARSAGAVARSRPDLVFVPAWASLSLGVVAGRLASAPVVVHLHDAPWSLGRQTRWAAQQVARYIAPSSASARHWAAKGVPEDRIEEVSYGVDLRRLRPPTPAERSAARAALVPDRPDWSGPLVVMVGRVAWSKGSDLGIEAVAALRRSGIDIELVVAGSAGSDGHAHPDVEIPHWVRQTGWLDDPTIAYHGADLVVIPTRRWDTLPFSGMEALACGVPLVGSAVGGLNDLAGALGPRHVVPEADAAALAAAIADVLRDPPQRAAVRALAEARYDASAYHRELDRIVQEVVAAPR